MARPEWLAPYITVLERACAPKPKFIAMAPPPGFGKKRVVVHAPPQHGKTTITMMALLYWATFFPGMRHAYVTYNGTKAKDTSEEFKALAESLGFTVQGTKEHLLLNGATRIKFTSMHGSLTGYPVDGVIIIDDPFKDSRDARSEANRKNAQRWYRTVARARRHPATSIIVMATRWHEDDLSGYLLEHEKAESWTYLRLSCIAEAENDNDLAPDGTIKSDPLHRKVGQWLWAERAAEMGFFAGERENPYDWATTYQGRPRTREGTLFKRHGDLNEDGTPAGPGWYRKLPDKYLKHACGIDLAYTRSTLRDWSILIYGLVDQNGDIYIVDVVRRQVQADDFADILKGAKKIHRGAPMRWYVGPTEKGTGQLMRKLGVDGMKCIPARGDKPLRATPASIEWNRGRILLPDPEAIPAEWLESFMKVICAFTGENDEADDDVDALAALIDELIGTAFMRERIARLRKKAA
jgi:predicted phage terminase large subunit-like protein